MPRAARFLPQAAISATNLNVVYSEGLKMGYRWYDAKSIQPLFPFGHGSSRDPNALAQPLELRSSKVAHAE